MALAGVCPTAPPTTTTTTATMGKQCPEVPINWKRDWQGPADDGAACFNGNNGWRNYKCVSGGRTGESYCKTSNRGYKALVDKCCPGLCPTTGNAGVFISELGKVTWTGKGPYGKGQPLFGSAASQPALLFYNKDSTTTINWENKITEMTLLYSDADFNEKITFSTNGAGTTYEMAALGPTDSWAKPNMLSGSGNDRNDDPKDFSKIIIRSPAGFTQLSMAHGHI